MFTEGLYTPKSFIVTASDGKETAGKFVGLVDNQDVAKLGELEKWALFSNARNVYKFDGGKWYMSYDKGVNFPVGPDNGKYRVEGDNILLCNKIGEVKQTLSLKGNQIVHTKTEVSCTFVTVFANAELPSETYEPPKAKPVAPPSPEQRKVFAPKIPPKPAEPPKPVVAERPKPVIVEQPKPVEQPRPVIIEQPKPVEPPKIVEQPRPVIVEQPKHVEPPKPVIVEQPKPEPPKPVPPPKPVAEPKNISIKRYEKTDETAVFDLLRAEGDEWQDYYYSADKFKHYRMAINNCIVYVCHDGKSVYGFVRAWHDENFGICVLDLLLHKSFRGFSFGQRLMEQIVKDYPDKTVYAAGDTNIYRQNLVYIKAGTAFTVKERKK